jgi:hypothetical protein
VPESKHRKKRKQKKAGPPLPKSVTAAPKKKITRQQIAIYVISALVVLSMAVGLLLSGGSSRAPVPTSAPVDVESLFTETPAPAEATTEPSAE